jgi:hypothetical protein
MMHFLLQQQIIFKPEHNNFSRYIFNQLMAQLQIHHIISGLLYESNKGRYIVLLKYLNVMFENRI